MNTKGAASNSTLVIAPHPDDETLGCGGTLLKLRDQGAQLHWVIVTAMTAQAGYSADRMGARAHEIDTVAARYGFATVHQLGFATTRLDTVPLSDLVSGLTGAIEAARPGAIFLPYPGDIHSDHSVVFKAGAACTKAFRHPFIKRVLVYEALSETDFSLDPDANGFRPNVFSDISGRIDEKIEILGHYDGELGAFPFPRSPEAVRAQAMVRGVAAGTQAAEAFMLLREIW